VHACKRRRHRSEPTQTARTEICSLSASLVCLFRRSGASSRAPANRRPSPAQVKIALRDVSAFSGVCCVNAYYTHTCSPSDALGITFDRKHTNHTLTHTQTHSLAHSLWCLIPISRVALIVVVLVPVSACLYISLSRNIFIHFACRPITLTHSSHSCPDCPKLSHNNHTLVRCPASLHLHTYIHTQLFLIQCLTHSSCRGTD
jgi:hypothetical protein